MQRTDTDPSNPPHRPHRVALVAFVAAGLLLLSCGPRATSDLRARTSADAAAAEASARRDREAARHARTGQQILALVREHRRNASEAWKRELADAVHREALAADLDPLFVASIVARESSFRSRVVSRAGAVGLMQLRPWVARDVAHRGHVEWRGVETLHDPQLNLRLGILYFKELLERFDGDAEMALAAYNAGPTRVTHQVRRGHYRGSRYADGVLGLYRELSREAPLASVRG